MDRATIDEVNAGITKRLYVWGTAKYETFKVIHSTNFCFAYAGNNAFFACAFHNEIDEQHEQHQR